MSISFSRTLTAVARVFIASLFLAALCQLAGEGAPAISPVRIAAAQTTGDTDTLLISHRRHRPGRTSAIGAETLIVNRGGKRSGIVVDDSGHGGDIVLMGDDVVVDKDEVVGGDAVAIGGSVTVMGKVIGDVVAIGGDVTLGDSSSVGGDAVSVGGTVDRAAGAKIGGQVVNVGVKIPVPFVGKLHSSQNRAHHPFLDLVRWLIFYMLVLAAAALCIYFFKDRIGYAGSYLSREPILSTLLGVLSPAMLLIAAVLLCITLIGILVAIPLVLSYPLFLFVGWVVTGQRLGSAINGERDVTVRTMFTGLAIISGLHVLGLLLRVFGVSGFPVIMLQLLGITISFTAALVGLGAMLGTRFRRPPEAAAPAGYSPPYPGSPGGTTGPVPQTSALPSGSTYTPPAVSQMKSPGPEPPPVG